MRSEVKDEQIKEVRIIDEESKEHEEADGGRLQESGHWRQWLSREGIIRASACPDCQGMGVQRTCNPASILVNSSLSILNGAITTNKAIGYYANINGQFIATLKEVAKQQGWNIDTPWAALDDEIKQFEMNAYVFICLCRVDLRYFNNDSIRIMSMSIQTRKVDK